MGTVRPFRFGVVAAQVRAAREWVTLARRIEGLGYSTMQIPDTMGPTLSPFVALTAAATATTSLRVGTYVLANDVRNPVLLARECATLDYLSEGRFELGIGVGRPGVAEDMRKLGLSYNSGPVRVERLTDALPIIKLLLSGEKISTTNNHYAVEEADVFPLPVQRPHPPVLVAGTGNRVLALAAREADIIALGVSPTDRRAVAEEKIAWVRQSAGERFDAIELNANLVGAGQDISGWLRARLGSDLQSIVQSGSIAFLMGSVDDMCEQLVERRATLGISYLSVAQDLMDSFAPVVERLRDR